MYLLLIARQLQFVFRGLLRFLRKAVQQHQPLFVHDEDNPGDTMPDCAAQLPETAAERAADRHADGPALLDGRWTGRSSPTIFRS